MYAILSFLCYAFAVVDFILGNFCDIDLTGFSWSPILAICLGSLFSYLGKKKNEEVNEGQVE